MLVSLDKSCSPNTSAVPKNCSVLSDVSVHIRVSCLTLAPVIILEPSLTNKNPAVLASSGFQTSGLGPISALTSAHLINIGSNEPTE